MKKYARMKKPTMAETRPTCWYWSWETGVMYCVLIIFDIYYTSQDIKISFNEVRFPLKTSIKSQERKILSIFNVILIIEITRTMTTIHFKGLIVMFMRSQVATSSSKSV